MILLFQQWLNRRVNFQLNYNKDIRLIYKSRGKIDKEVS